MDFVVVDCWSVDMLVDVEGSLSVLDCTSGIGLVETRRVDKFDSEATGCMFNEDSDELRRFALSALRTLARYTPSLMIPLGPIGCSMTVRLRPVCALYAIMHSTIFGNQSIIYTILLVA